MLVWLCISSNNVNSEIWGLHGTDDIFTMSTTEIIGILITKILIITDLYIYICIYIYFKARKDNKVS